MDKKKKNKNKNVIGRLDSSKAAYNINVSFQTGLSDFKIVFVFRLTPSESGMSLTLTYGSLKPLGSIGMRFRLNKRSEAKLINWQRA